MSLTLLSARSQASFAQQIEQQFVQGSAIDQTLFAATVHIVSDIEQLPGGDVAAPIHDALNWKLTRFGHQARSAMQAALLLQESGDCWQAKLSLPRKDGRGRIQKYETPVGNGSRAFLPYIPNAIRLKIAARYGVDVPLDGSFWDWLYYHSAIPIVFTEGGKKALSLLSLGYVAIALYGVNGGYSNIAGIRSLTADVQRFAAGNRSIALAFDQDVEAKTRSRVDVAMMRFGGLLATAGCDVAIVTWDGRDGKGVDDLIVACGAEAFDRAYNEALPLNHWQLWQRLENRLTYPASVRLTTADLSTLKLDSLPESGIIGVASAKGTGKTKFIAQTVAASGKVLAGGHRIALMRNLCERIRLDYRGDLDRVNGQFISGSGYSLRVGFCVDALLAIDPELFRDCDLVLDEAGQVLRHLLTSSTCNKEGMRPLLLARFAQLVRAARRVIVADADLDNATLHYLRQLRGDDAPVFLIRNDYQAAGYAVRFIESSDRSGITADLLKDIGNLQPGKVLFVATDSKRISNAIALIIQQQYPDRRVLLLNSDTSGGEIEQAFIKNPDAELQNYDVVIASPSLATGVSIEAQGTVAKVYGIFTGGSSTDADMAQALDRVREPVERVVWCAKRGSNFSKVSRSANPLELKSHLQQQTSVAASLVKLSLNDATHSAIGVYDWAGDLHLNLWSHFTAEQNRSMFCLRDALLVRLRHEGHRVSIEARETDPAMKLLLKASRDELKQLDAESIANADELAYSEIALLQTKESLSHDERRAVANFHLRDFYGLETLTPEDVLRDREGRYRGELLNLEAQLYPDVAVDRTARALEKQAGWNQGLCPWDISSAAVRQWMREKIGLNDFLTVNRAWSQSDYELYADRARGMAAQIKMVLHFTIKPEMSDAQVVNQLLSQLGLKLERQQRRIDGDRVSFYRLDSQRWQQAIDILNRRKQQRESMQQRGNEPVTPPPYYFKNQGGVTAENPQAVGDVGGVAAWLTPDSLADIRSMLEAAAGDRLAMIELRRIIPQQVLERAILRRNPCGIG